MEDSPLHIPLQPVKLDEAELVVLRQFFQAREGQRLLQLMRQWRPIVASKTSLERTMELEKRYGYEECFDTLLSILRPKTTPQQLEN